MWSLLPLYNLRSKPNNMHRRNASRHRLAVTKASHGNTVGGAAMYTTEDLFDRVRELQVLAKHDASKNDCFTSPSPHLSRFNATHRSRRLGACELHWCARSRRLAAPDTSLKMSRRAQQQQQVPQQPGATRSGPAPSRRHLQRHVRQSWCGGVACCRTWWTGCSVR